MGWRLPSVVELSSVRDLLLPAPFVPDSVFSGVLGGGRLLVDVDECRVSYQRVVSAPLQWKRQLRAI